MFRQPVEEPFLIYRPEGPGLFPHNNRLASVPSLKHVLILAGLDLIPH